MVKSGEGSIMTIEEIVRGESRNVEFKMTIPKESEKYTKSVVAFANSQGGKLVFGVDDKTRKVVGIDEDELFRIMDSISNAISDSCKPQIVPNIEPQTVDGKTVIVVTVTPGANRPYYLKSKGKDKGTFIRVAGTSRLSRESEGIGTGRRKDLLGRADLYRI
jgi:predicted HTH transcriptional regulator